MNIFPFCLLTRYASWHPAAYLILTYNLRCSRLMPWTSTPFPSCNSHAQNAKDDNLQLCHNFFITAFVSCRRSRRTLSSIRGTRSLNSRRIESRTRSRRWSLPTTISPPPHLPKATRSILTLCVPPQRTSSETREPSRSSPLPSTRRISS